MRLRALVLPLIGLFALWASPLAVAAETSSVAGTVYDESRMALEDVEVGLISLLTGQTILTHTDVAGQYGFAGLASGDYSLYFELADYAVQRLGPFELLPDSPREWVVELELLGAPLTRPLSGLDTISVEYGMVREQIQSLPILLGSEGRTTVDKFLTLVPGLSPVDSLEIDAMTGRSSAVSANGSRRSAINYQFDGAPNNAQNRLTGAQAATFAPVPDALENFRVITHTYSAPEGRNAGAVVQGSSRSVQDRWHGGLRGFYRARQNRIESYDGSIDSLSGWAGGGQIGGPLWAKHKLHFFLDAEGWTTEQQHVAKTSNVLTVAERSGDLSALGSAVADPLNLSESFPNGVIPQDRLNPLMQRYLNAFLPLPNAGVSTFEGRQDLPAEGQTLLARVDKGWSKFALSASHLTYRTDGRSPLVGAAPGALADSRQLSNSARATLTHAPSASLVQRMQVSAQRLSIALWQGVPEYRDTTANEFGFNFADFGSDPATIPDLTLYDGSGAKRFHIAPFLSSEQSVQSTWQLRHDVEWRRGGHAVRVGGSFGQGSWPFRNTDSPAGSFSFPLPPDPPVSAGSNGLQELLLGLPSEYRFKTPRDLNLQWHELALYAETELQPLRGLHLTFGMRFESQPPAVDTQDRIAAFRPRAESERFPETLTGLIFPGDVDGESGVLPRSGVESDGRQFAPRVGVAWSPTSDDLLTRMLIGPTGRSVLRASYGQFYDFGAFAGSSAAALFQATYPPFSVDNRFNVSRSGDPGSFDAPLSVIPDAKPDAIISSQVSYPILVFDRGFENALSHQWNLGLQRPLPGGVNLSVVYVGTRSVRLQRQRELNGFVRSFIAPFSSIRNMRQFTALDDVRQLESSGSSRYNALQVRANRYLRRGLAFDLGYTWSRSDDNGSSVFGEELATETWGVSDYDRQHSFVASWVWQPNLPRAWSERLSFLDSWTISGFWRLRSGLPLDIRQDEDPTFTFVRVGRPDIVAPFESLDPSVERTFTLADGRTVTGRFAFDPTVFEAVTPGTFTETRPGNLGRNAFRMRGYQQWDVRLSRSVNLAEGVSVEFGIDMINVFGNKSWDAPFATVEDPSFGIVRKNGIGRNYQAVVRLEF
jgi:hypothetical protein